MVAALQRLLSATMQRTGLPRVFGRKQEADLPTIGEYEVEYGPLPPGGLQETDPDADALIEQSRVVSAKSGL